MDKSLNFCPLWFILYASFKKIKWKKFIFCPKGVKKQETICEELGDRAGLAICWWNQGLIHNQNKNYTKQIQLWEKSIQMKKKIGIPTEKNEKALAKLKKDRA
ncbi:MAG: hypothetical protein PVH61_13805 [Candidatus Aminicenantes bacterium]|jgi:hypothetical protein